MKALRETFLFEILVNVLAQRRKDRRGQKKITNLFSRKGAEIAGTVTNEGVSGVFYSLGLH
jgi:hypothetical protein